MGTLVSKREDEGKTFPCESSHIFMRSICNLDVKVQSRNTIHKRMNGEKSENLISEIFNFNAFVFVIFI